MDIKFSHFMYFSVLALAATVIGNLDKVEKFGLRQALPSDVEIDAYLVGATKVDLLLLIDAINYSYTTYPFTLMGDPIYGIHK